jgi:hypothetical protein
MQRLRVYVDTTVFSAADDDRAPDRMQLTRDFFDRSEAMELVTSELTRREIDATPSEQRRKRIHERLKLVGRVDESVASDLLAKEYIARDVIPAAYADDASHVAIATVSACHTRQA